MLNRSNQNTCSTCILHTVQIKAIKKFKINQQTLNEFSTSDELTFLLISINERVVETVFVLKKGDVHQRLIHISYQLKIEKLTQFCQVN